VCCLLALYTNLFTALWHHIANFGHAMQAREILEHAVRIDVTQPGPHKTSAELEMDLGQFERARLILLKGQ
jgi:Tfp pilus assembly protein PilF